MCLLSTQVYSAPLPRHRFGSFKALALCSQRLKPLQGGRVKGAPHRLGLFTPPLEYDMQKLSTLPWLTRTSSCCSLPLLLLKTFASDDPSWFPCLWVGCVSCRPLSKVTQQVWSGMPASLSFVLFCSHCSSELCGSFLAPHCPGNFTHPSLWFFAVPLCCFCSVLSLSHWTLPHSLPPTSAILKPQ